MPRTENACQRFPAQLRQPDDKNGNAALLHPQGCTVSRETTTKLTPRWEQSPMFADVVLRPHEIHVTPCAPWGEAKAPQALAHDSLSIMSFTFEYVLSRDVSPRPIC